MKNISSSKGESMKEKIERFARGEFDEQLPKVELPKEPLFWEMEPESTFTGYLRFRSENGVRIRGYVLCSDGNMKIASPQFYGKLVKIEFSYHSKNTEVGDKKRGKLILITNAGEFLVPFEVRIQKKSPEEGENFHG
jgi:hypothetical protein